MTEPTTDLQARLRELAAKWRENAMLRDYYKGQANPLVRRRSAPSPNPDGPKVTGNLPFLGGNAHAQILAVLQAVADEARAEGAREAREQAAEDYHEQLAYPCGYTAKGPSPLPRACPEHGAVCGDPTPLLDPGDPETQRRIANGTISAIDASSAQYPAALLELRLSELETATQNLSRFLRERAQTKGRTHP